MPELSKSLAAVRADVTQAQQAEHGEAAGQGDSQGHSQDEQAGARYVSMKINI